MKYRTFTIKDDLTQLEYITFRTGVQELRPPVWTELEETPLEIFYDTVIRSAILAGWIIDVVEENEYGEEDTFVWLDSGIEYLNGLPPMNSSIVEWGRLVFNRWVEIRQIDPN